MSNKKHPVKAMHIAKKLFFRLLGGDCNEIVSAGNEGRFEDLAAYCGAVNNGYSGPVFSRDNVRYMKSNWSECMDAYNTIAEDPWKYRD